MQPQEESPLGGKEPQHTMARRGFLKAAGSAAGLAALLGPDALRGVEAALNSAAGLTPQQAAREESLWGEVQQAFTVHRGLIHLDNGYTCPSPRVVTEAVVRYIWDQEQGPYGLWVREAGDRLDTVRVALARLFGAAPEEIGIMRNATEALKTVLYGVPLQPGDEALTTMHDYGSMVGVLRHREQRDGIKLVRVPVPTPPKSTDELVGIFERAITPKTRLILVSQVVECTGLVFPVKRICDLAHRHGIEVVCDGAHAFGHLDFKQADLNCDYFGASLHKWLGAPKSTGMLYVRKDKIEKTWPLYPSSSRSKDSIEKFERHGVQSLAPVLGIAEALAFHNGIGSARKEARLRYLSHYWAERLQKLPGIQMNTSLKPELSCGIVNFALEGVNLWGLGPYLEEEHHILTASGGSRRGGPRGLRISPNVYTTLDELDYFCEVVEDVAENGLPEPYKSREPRRWRRSPEQSQPTQSPPG